MITIFIPGIKGSGLVNTYPESHKTIWSTEDVLIGDIFENPLEMELKEGFFDTNDQVIIRPSGVLFKAYSSIIQNLRSFSPRSYIFTYDWRQPIEKNANELKIFIKYLQDKLGETKGSSINFVTHSMGGLVLRSTLRLLTSDFFPKINKIVFIAPPFKGSVSAIENLIKGEKDGWFGKTENYRKLARTFPSVYQLLPHYKGAVVDGSDGTELDIFDRNNWQANVISDKKDIINSAYLTRAEKFFKGEKAIHNGISEIPILNDEEILSLKDKTLVLISVGHETKSQVKVFKHNENINNWYDFDNAIIDKKYGDGRVHIFSAGIKGIRLAGYKNIEGHALVCNSEPIIKNTLSWLKGEIPILLSRRNYTMKVNRDDKMDIPVWDGSLNFDKHIGEV